MRCHASFTTAQTNTTTKGPSLCAIASHPFWLLQAEVYNTTDTAFQVALQRITAFGSGGTALTEICASDSGYTPVMTAVDTQPTNVHTVAAGEFQRCTIGAIKGAGNIWTFGEKGLYVPAGTANGVALLIPAGSGQAFDYTFIWDE